VTRRRLALGESGEAIAARALRRAGYRILAERYACPLGEVDLVARDGGTLVFVEVKTRSSADRYPPGEAVHLRKQRQIARVAEHYLAAIGAGAVPCRFDVVAITVPEGGGPPRIEVIRDAFPAEGIEVF
jgi:putative endonuclease